MKNKSTRTIRRVLPMPQAKAQLITPLVERVGIVIATLGAKRLAVQNGHGRFVFVVGTSRIRGMKIFIFKVTHVIVLINVLTGFAR